MRFTSTQVEGTVFIQSGELEIEAIYLFELSWDPRMKNETWLSWKVFKILNLELRMSILLG